jgi:hypothetical protein
MDCEQDITFVNPIEAKINDLKAEIFYGRKLAVRMWRDGDGYEAEFEFGEIREKEYEIEKLKIALLVAFCSPDNKV